MSFERARPLASYKCEYSFFFPSHLSATICDHHIPAQGPSPAPPHPPLPTANYIPYQKQRRTPSLHPDTLRSHNMIAAEASHQVSPMKAAGSILRSRGMDGNAQHPASANRRRRQDLTVRFPSDPASVVTAVHTRPRTHDLDVGALYYSSEEVRRFKRDRKLARSTEKYRSRQERLGRLLDVCCAHDDGVERPECKEKHDNSSWRSKVQRRWNFEASSPRDGAKVVPLSPPCSHDDGSWNESDHDEGTEFTSPPASTGTTDQGAVFANIFSSIGDAMSILSGQGKSNERFTMASSHLVDTYMELRV